MNNTLQEHILHKLLRIDSASNNFAAIWARLSNSYGWPQKGNGRHRYLAARDRVVGDVMILASQLLATTEVK